MKRKPSGYQLDAAEFQDALAILKREQQANLPTRPQRILFILLNIAAYGVVLSIVSTVVLGILSLYLTGLFIVAATVLFFLNFPLVLKLVRQGRLVRRLGLSQVLHGPWKAERKKHRFLNVITIVVGCFGVVVILFGLLMIILGGMYSLLGPIVGSALFLILEKIILARTEYWPICMGVILTLSVLFLRGGLVGFIQSKTRKGNQ